MTAHQVVRGALLATVVASSVWLGYQAVREAHAFWADLDRIGDYPLTEDQAVDHDDSQPPKPTVTISLDAAVAACLASIDQVLNLHQTDFVIASDNPGGPVP